jgi:hypothetical protein
MAYIEYYAGGTASGYVSIIDPLQGSGYDYANLNAWANARKTALGGNGNLALSGFTEVAECRGGGNLLGPLAGSANGLMLEAYFTGHAAFPATRVSITIRAASGYECGEVFDTNKCWVDASGSNFAISCQNDDYIYIENIWASGADSTNLRMINSDGGHVSGCVSIGLDELDATASWAIYVTGDEAYIINCIATDITANGSSNAAFYVGGASDDEYIFNCTVIDCYRGMYIALATADIETENCYWDVSFEISNRDTSADWTRHLADITSHGSELPLARSGVLKEWCYEKPYGPDWDFTMRIGSPLVNEGLDISPAASGGVSEDIRGLARPYSSAFDVGAVEASGVIAVRFPDVFVGGYTWGWITEPAVYAGSYVLSIAPVGQMEAGLLGGVMSADSGTMVSATIGGYINSLQLTTVPVAIIGGFGSGQFQEDAIIGGYAFGCPNYTEYAEAQARVLAKANSENAAGQSLNIDAEISLIGQATKEFYGLLELRDTNKTDFNAILTLGKSYNRPTVTITSVTPASGSPTISGPVTVVASGALGDGDFWDKIVIDWGEEFDEVTATTGEPPWSGTFSYSTSGIYAINVRAKDNNGAVGSDVYLLNYASGLVQGVDFPYIRLTGTPRSGIVPPSLSVSFTIEASGIQTGFNMQQTDRVYWNFGNGHITEGKLTPNTLYSTPGWYAPVVRYLYSSGVSHRVWVSDTLLIGYNR